MISPCLPIETNHFAMVFIAQNCLFLVSKNQFLPLYRSLEDSILIDKAQHALEGNSRVKDSDLVALHKALETFKPALVIAKIASLKKARFTDIMSENNYVQRLIKNKDVLYQRLP